jgi:hypothetical protein
MRGKGKTDPRLTLSDQALIEANALAMPKVAVAGGDSGLAIGAAIAIGLGVLVFNQMSIARLKRIEAQPQPIVIEAAAPQIVAAPRPLGPMTFPWHPAMMKPRARASGPSACARRRLSSTADLPPQSWRKRSAPDRARA